MPWPPPTHMVSKPNVLSCVCRLFSSVVAMRAPVMPNGWPSAIAPPDTFRWSSSMPNSRAQPHDLRREAADPGGHDAGQRCQAELLGLLVAGDHQCGGAVVERAGIP